MDPADLEARIDRLELTLLEVVTALGMLTGELAQRHDLALTKPEQVEQALEAGWTTLFGDRIERDARTLFEVPGLEADPVRLRREASRVIGRAVSDTGAAVGALYAVDRDGGKIDLLASVGYPREMMASFLSFPLDADLPAAAVARTGTPLWFGRREEIIDRYPDLRKAHEQTESAVGREGAEGAVMPLTREGDVVGVLLVGFTFVDAGDATAKLRAIRDRIATAVAS